MRQVGLFQIQIWTVSQSKSFLGHTYDSACSYVIAISFSRIHRETMQLSQVNTVDHEHVWRVRVWCRCGRDIRHCLEETANLNDYLLPCTARKPSILPLSVLQLVENISLPIEQRWWSANLIWLKALKEGFIALNIGCD